MSKASPSQRWKVSIWAFIPPTVNSSRGGRMDFAVDRAGWESGVCVLFWKGIHCAPPIRLNYCIKSRHSPASFYSSCEIIAGMVSSLRSVRISQPLSVTTIVCSYCADKLRSWFYRPAIFIVRISFTRVDHWLDGERHPRFQHDVGFTGVIVQHLRFFVEAATNTVSTIFTNDGEAFCFDKFLNCRTDFAQINAVLPCVAPYRLSCVMRHRRSPMMVGLPTINIFEVSPWKPSLITVTSMLTISPSFSSLASSGIPWHTTSLIEMQTDFDSRDSRGRQKPRVVH